MSVGTDLDDLLFELHFKCSHLEKRVEALEKALLALRDLVVELEKLNAVHRAS